MGCRDKGVTNTRSYLQKTVHRTERGLKANRRRGERIVDNSDTSDTCSILGEARDIWTHWRKVPCLADIDDIAMHAEPVSLTISQSMKTIHATRSLLARDLDSSPNSPPPAQFTSDGMSKSEALPDDGAASEVALDLVRTEPASSCDLDGAAGDAEDGPAGVGGAGVADDGEAHRVVGGTYVGDAGERDGGRGRRGAAVPRVVG